MAVFRKAILVLSVFFLLLTFAYANGGKDDSSSSKQIKIGVTWTDLSNEWAAKMAEAARAEAKRLGVKLIEADSRFDTAKQISQAENFVIQGVDVIILHPDDNSGSAPVVVKAKAAGIPVVLVNSTVSNIDMCETYVGSDDVTAGELQAGFMAKALNGKGNIVILDGPMGTSPQINRGIGYQNILADYPEIKILAEQSASWDRAKALAITENWLTAGLPINGILAENDEMALGAAAAVKESGKADSIIVTGIDAIPDAIKAVTEGRMAATVFQDAVGQGTSAVNAAYRIAKGEKVPDRIMIPFVLVTKDNVSEYIEN